jgi:hypothetical protein
MLNLQVLGYILLCTLFQQGEILWCVIMCLRQTRAQNTATVDRSAYVNTDVLKNFNTAKCIMFLNEKVTKHFSTNITKSMSNKQPTGN